MDLGALISQSAARIRNNWILIVPPILTQVIVPLAALTLASFVLFPLLMAYGLTGDTWGLIRTTVGGVLILAIGIFLVDTFVTAGWAYMNKRVVVDGRTQLADLWVGARRYFLRILGGRILVAAILAIPVVAGIAAVAASVLGISIGQLVPPEGLAPSTVVSLLAPVVLGLLGIILAVGLIELVLYVFLLPWMQALVMDDLGIAKSIKLSLAFVRRNFPTMMGYVVISGVAWVVASWVASFMWPGFSYSELTNPIVYANGTRLLEMMLRANNIVYYVISALLSAFFTLLMFLIYADRTRGPQSPASVTGTTIAPASQVRERSPPPRQTGRGIKYCTNCGTSLVVLAVFCPNCGARQPPLQPE